MNQCYNNLLLAKGFNSTTVEFLTRTFYHLKINQDCKSHLNHIFSAPWAGVGWGHWRNYTDSRKAGERVGRGRKRSLSCPGSLFLIYNCYCCCFNSTNLVIAAKDQIVAPKAPPAASLPPCPQGRAGLPMATPLPLPPANQIHFWSWYCTCPAPHAWTVQGLYVMKRLLVGDGTPSKVAPRAGVLLVTP